MRVLEEIYKDEGNMVSKLNKVDQNTWKKYFETNRDQKKFGISRNFEKQDNTEAFGNPENKNTGFS